MKKLKVSAFGFSIEATGIPAGTAIVGMAILAILAVLWMGGQA